MSRDNRGRFVTAQQAAANKREESVAYVLAEAVAQAVDLLKRGVYRTDMRRWGTDGKVHTLRFIEADHRHLAERALLDGARAAELLLARSDA